MIRRTAAVAFAMGALGWPAVASAEPQWLAPAKAFDASAAHEVATAMAPDGTALIARVRTATAGEVLEALVKPPGQPWGAPIEVARSNAGRFVDMPQAWAAPDGTFAIGYYDAFRRGGPEEADGRVVLLAPDGRPSDRFALVLDMVSGAGLKPQFDAHGTAYFLQRSDRDYTVYRRARGVGTALPVPLPPNTSKERWLPRLSVAPDGEVAIVSVGATGAGCDMDMALWLSALTRDAFGAAQKLTSTTATGVMKDGECESTGQSLAWPAAVSDPAGAMTIAVQRTDLPSKAVTVLALHRPAGGQWGQLETVGQAFDSPMSLTMAGSTPTLTLHFPVAVWSARSADGRWQKLVPVFPRVTSRYPDVAMAPLGDGSTIYLWSDAGLRLLASRVRPDGELEGPDVLANITGSDVLLTQEFAIGADAAGNAIAVFTAGDGEQAQYAAFDGAGPIVRGVSIPGQGAPGEPRPFTVESVMDLWSGVAPLSWLFSDGGSATGASVAHAFAAPGTYTATLRATDAIGNRTTVTGPVTLPSPVVSTPPPAAVRDTTAPVFTSKPKVRRGQVTFALSEPAQVVAVVTRRSAGVRRGTRCVAPPRRKTKARACARQVTVATVRAAKREGTGKLALPKAARRKGTYTVTLSITDAAGNVTRTRTTYRIR